MDFNIPLNNDESSYCVNLQQVIDSNDICATIRLLAIDLKKRSYLSLGDFFKNLSERSLDELLEIANHSADEESELNDTALQDLSLLTLMLAEAEGVTITDDQQMCNCLNALNVIICGVSLARKGLVKVHYNNLSLGEDMYDKPVIERIQ